METEVEETRFQLTAPSKTQIKEKIRFDDPRFHLHIIHKTESRSQRPVIHSTKKERLAFYRIFTSTTSKNDVMPSQHTNVNNFLWFYTLNVFFKTIPHSFVHYFISAYAPEEHMFITKMVPISHGIKYLFAMAGLLDLLICVDMLVLLLHYTISGLLLKNPWNRCPEPNSYWDEFSNVTIHCLHITDFADMFENRSYHVHGYSYILDAENHFQVSQIEYYRLHVYHAEYIRDFTLFIIIWASMTLFHHFCKLPFIWKIVYYDQWVIIFVDIITYLYMILAMYGKKPPQVAYIDVGEEPHSSGIFSPDLDLLSESITAPPIVHILTSRSSQEIDPSLDSTVMVLSNAILYIFRGLHSLKVKAHCEALLHTEIPINHFNQHQWFYFFPIFWSQFYLGDIFSNIYFLLNLVLEYLVIMITYLCVVECIIYEWPIIKRWMCMILLGLAGVAMFIFTTVDDRIVFWTYGKGLATLLETIFLYVFYPVGRLVDDYTFHYGRAPTRLRLLSMRLVPVYYLFKFYIMIDSVFDVMAVDELGQQMPHYYWSWGIMVLPIVGGIIYITYKYLVVYRMTWNYIFRPKAKWGPQDFSERQLRKQFDSRYEVDSQSNGRPIWTTP
ncbi:unnamed protein product [Chrysodeixis includens]|uniref:Transmembrane protein n=1 Tax=Chrysodeixis includens TaxID=689277 RepID=A0A9P0BZY9_CHRIL|nr:unnamed protein product [Chrysodeixis includens]